MAIPALKKDKTKGITPRNAEQSKAISKPVISWHLPRSNSLNHLPLVIPE